MRFGITYRLFLTILGATFLAILALFLIVQWSLDRGFYQYLGKMEQNSLEELVGDLGRGYAEKKNWDFLKKGPPPRRSDNPNSPSPSELPWEPGKPGAREEPGKPPPAFGPKPGGGPFVVLNADRRPVFGFYPPGATIHFRPISARGRTVGYVGLLPPKHFLHPMQVEFLQQQRLALALPAACVLLVIALISLPLARRLVKPIRAMGAATREIAAGSYAARIPVLSSDELGRLARDFNQMAQTLEKHEKARRQWVADISHELRTPVAVLQGEIEALLDGIRAVTPERIRSLHGETLRLNRLVEDLYQLSLSDIGALTYRKEQTDPADLLRKVTETYHPAFQRKGISLTTHLAGDQEILVFADRERLDQLFANLVENSRRFTDPGGELVINLSSGNDRIIIEFQDSSPGVPEQELDRLFERLYRVEGSRSRTLGGAGLGLAICKNIVEAHAGSISAHPSPLGGLLIRISLPVSGSRS